MATPFPFRPARRRPLAAPASPGRRTPDTMPRKPKPAAKPKPPRPVVTAPRPTAPAVQAAPVAAPKPAARKGTGRFQTFKRDVKLGQGQSLGFTKGKGYYAKPKQVTRQAASPVKRGRGSAPPPTGPSAAELAVNAALAPLLLSLRNQQTEQDRIQADERQQLSGFTREFLGYLGMGPGQVSGIYGPAVQSIGSFAQQAAAGQSASNPNPQIQADMQAINAPAEQQAQVGAGVDAAYPGAAAVLLATGGTIPQAMMQGQAKSAGDYAGMLPGIQSLASLNAFKSLMFKQMTDRTRLQSQLQELQAKKPGMLLEAKQSTREAQRKAAYEQFKMNLLAQEFGLKVGKAKVDASYKQGQLKLKDKALNVQVAKLERQSQQWAARFGLDQQKLALAEAKVRLAPKKGGFTASQKQKLRATAFDYARDGIQGWIDKDTGERVWPTDPSGARVKPVDMLRDLIGQGIPFSIAVRAVARFYPPARKWYGKRKPK